MCNLNILFKNKKARHNDLLTAFNFSCAASYAMNTDGAGVYFEFGNKLITSADNIDVNKYKNNFINSSAVIGHERIATSGHSLDNLQPFQNERFVFVHNGVLYGFNNHKEKSDSKEFFEVFCYNYSLIKDVVIAIKQTLKTERGSYSILIYDKLDKIGYYFKNDATTISFYAGEGILVGFTKDSNKNFFKDLKSIKIKEYNIYKIENLNIKSVGTIEHKDFYEKFDYEDDYKKRYTKKKDITTIQNYYDDMEQYDAKYIKRIVDYD